jgi:hypothetical protein
MAIVSMGVAALAFAIGFLLRKLIDLPASD